MIKKKTGPKTRKPGTRHATPPPRAKGPASGAKAAQSKRVLGSAAGTITLKPGWDDPMTEEELAEFIGD